MKKLFFLILLFPVATYAQSGIHGIVTYFFDDNYGYKADLGGDVWVIDAAEIPSFDKWTVATYVQAHPGDKSFDEVDQKTFMLLINLRVNKKCHHQTIDGNGSYSMKISPGHYYLYMRSANRKAQTMTEMQGKIYWKEFDIASDEDIEVSQKFEL